MAQGVLALVLAVITDNKQLPAASWVLGFLGVVLLSTGALLWHAGAEALENAKRAAWTARRAAQTGRMPDDWADQ